MVATTVLKFVVLSVCAQGLAAATATTAQKIRPCPNLDNACVGKILAAYSSCSLESLPTDQASLDPFSLDHFFFYTPYFNVTEDRYNITIEGQNQTYVSDFYYDSATGKTVLELFLPYTRFEGDTILHLLQTGEDAPLDVNTHYVVAFQNMTLTTVFNNYLNLEFSNSLTFPNLPIEPTFENGQGLADAAAADPRVAFLNAAYNAQPYVATLEAFVYRAPALVKLFTNYKLCYYGDS